MELCISAEERRRAPKTRERGCVTYRQLRCNMTKGPHRGRYFCQPTSLARAHGGGAKPVPPPLFPGPAGTLTVSPASTHDAADPTARLMLVAVSLAWGLSWPAMKIALNEIPPFSMRVSTSGLATVALFALAV